MKPPKANGQTMVEAGGRTAEDKLIGKSITLGLGGNDYSVQPKSYKRSKLWCAKYSAYVKNVTDIEQIKAADIKPDELAENMTFLMFGSFDDLVDLFFEYADELQPDRDKIEDSATAWEIYIALQEIVSLANPPRALAQMLQLGAMQTLSGSKDTTARA